MIRVLPQELLDAIIDEIDVPVQRTRLNLFCCTLSAENISDAIPLPIGSTLESKLCFQSLREAHIILAESPHLAAYVRDLTIELPDAAPKFAALEGSVTSSDWCMASWIGLYPPGAASALLDCPGRPSLRRFHLLNVLVAPSAMDSNSVTAIQLHEATSAPRLRRLVLSAASLPLVEHIALSFFALQFLPEVVEWAAESLAIFGPSFLTERRELRHLRRVHCRLVHCVEIPSDALFGSFVEAFEAGMPGLDDKGILACTPRGASSAAI
ncbi:hypothetical protein DFH07DRAFT_952173 [Mycena maculata]|uniref:Uncharacterized protein n=1 Tax=Mycena maculata TaxID=230809 RepID=A0AAD7NTP2_9AGAR|nr:hypothetical protein DFH07DRAFT_952173 [Mycena maculata]